MGPFPLVSEHNHHHDSTILCTAGVRLTQYHPRLFSRRTKSRRSNGKHGNNKAEAEDRGAI